MIVLFSVFVPFVVFMFMLNYFAAKSYHSELLSNAKGSHNITVSSFVNQFDSYSKSVSLFMLNSQARSLIAEPETYTTSELTDLKIEVFNLVYFIENIQNSTNLRVYVKEDKFELVDYSIYYSIDDIVDSNWFNELRDSKYRNLWIDNDDYEGDTTLLQTKNSNPYDAILSYAVKVVITDDYNEFASVIRLDFSKQLIKSTLQKSLIIDKSAAYILDESNNVVVSASLDNGPDSLDFTNAALDDSLDKWGVMDIGGSKYQVLTSNLITMPWKMVTLVAVDDLNSLRYRGQLLFYIAILMLCGVLIFFSSMLFTRKITKQIALVADNMKNLCSGNFNLLPIPKNHDELSELIESYNYMTYELQMLIHSSYESGILLKNAEFKALQAQINPHFLYNTLDMINYHSYINQHETVEKIIFELTKFYKLSLNHGNDTYQIWREIDLVKSYFSIQNIRYDGKMELETEIDPACLEFTIPKIIFQPVIENAIIHGILNKSDKTGKISVTGTISRKMLHFEIKDNGIGMSQKQVETLNAEGARPLEEDDSSSHYGITNINERIKAFFGPQYRLHIESEQGKGTTVILTIPAKY